MTQVKATLKIVLQAGDTVVAEVDDPILWQEVLAVINKGPQENGARLTLRDAAKEVNDTRRESHREEPPAGDAVGRFAQQVGVERALVEGALSPSNEAPYLQLDAHRWSDMKRQVPDRGPGALNPISLASTLLALWFKHASLGNPTQAQAQGVLDTVNVRDKNPGRGLKSSDWLQTRSGGTVIINPARFPEALRIARSFCSGDWSTSAPATNNR